MATRHVLVEAALYADYGRAAADGLVRLTFRCLSIHLLHPGQHWRYCIDPSTPLHAKVVVSLMELQQLCTSLDRHSHEMPYVSVLLAGRYEEAGDQGRFELNVGDVIFHDRFEAHLDRIGSSRTIVLNLAPGAADAIAPGFARISDLDAVVRMAQKSPSEALALLLKNATRCVPALFDWEEALCAALIENDSLILSEWATANGLSPWTVSRGFKKIFAITPEAFRARARARRAFRRIHRSTAPLVEIALDEGFVDQPHMTRAIVQLTGASPTTWRAAKSAKDDGEPGRAGGGCHAP